MVRLDRPNREEFDRWFALSTDRQVEDRAWVNGTDPKKERAQLDAIVPVLLADGPDTAGHVFRIARDEAGGELGFAWFGVFPGVPEDTRVLFDIFVHEAHRGTGLGREILEPMLASLEQEGVREVTLFVRKDNGPARALYKKLGFAEDEAPAGARDLQMRKRLRDDHEEIPDDRARTFDRQTIVIEGFPASGYILDIGGGGGGVVGRAYGSRVVAIDRLKEELEETPDGPLQIVMDARDLQFLDRSFSTATSFFTLMYIKGEDHRRVFDEVFRVLSSDGRFLVWDAALPPRGDGAQEIAVVPVTAQLPGGEAISNYYGVRWPSEARDLVYYRQLAEEAGFEVLSQETKGQHLFLELRRP